MPLSRREVIRRGVTVVGAAVASSAIGCTPNAAPVGFALRSPDANGVMSPPGFRSRVLARTNEWIAGYLWHRSPDGGAVFPKGDGWVYVSNSESMPGGVGALEFDAGGRVVAARPILQNWTLSNCAGGATPWGTWLSCEEWEWGRVWECDPTGRRPAIDRPALGHFNHEAVAVDPEGRALYLTEDRKDGCLYRFVPDVWGNLGKGVLTVAVVDGDGAVTWRPVPKRNPTWHDTPTRYQVKGATTFDGGEGVDHRDGHLYFTTKGDHRVWDLDTRAMQLSIRYDRATSTQPSLQGPDNLVVAPDGSVLVAEDGGDLEIVLVDEAGRATPIVRLVGHDGSEIAGPAFDPSGTRLYFSSQRGRDGRGMTFELTGPFAQLHAAIARS